MKNTKKKVLVGALVVSLAALVSVGSVAWFSASDSVQNKFMVATSDEPDDPDKEFDVDVWEKTPDDDKDTDGTEYPDIMPGDELTKEVHVENTGKYDEYIRMVVTVSDAAAWGGLLNKAPADIALGNLVVGLNTTDFENDLSAFAYDESADTLTYVYYAKNVLAPDADLTLFDAVKIPDSMTEEQADAFTVKDGDEQGSFTLDVKAQAVQTANVGDNAKAAFATVGMSIND